MNHSRISNCRANRIWLLLLLCTETNTAGVCLCGASKGHKLTDDDSAYAPLALHLVFALLSSAFILWHQRYKLFKCYPHVAFTCEFLSAPRRRQYFVLWEYLKAALLFPSKSLQKAKNISCHILRYNVTVPWVMFDCMCVVCPGVAPCWKATVLWPRPCWGLCSPGAWLLPEQPSCLSSPADRYCPNAAPTNTPSFSKHFTLCCKWMVLEICLATFLAVFRWEDYKSHYCIALSKSKTNSIKMLFLICFICLNKTFADF